MIVLELDGQLAAAGIDVGAAGGPALVQSWVDTDDLSDWPLRRVGAGPFGEPHPQRFAEMLFERCVVGLRGGNVGFEQHPAVDGQPASVEGLDLVRDRDVGVQVRVAGPAVAVGERDGDEAPHVDLPDPLSPGPGEQGMLLEERSRRPARRPDGRVRSRPPPPDRRPPIRSTPTSPGRTSGHTRQLFGSAAGSLSRSVPPAPGHPSAPGHALRGRTRGPPRSAPGPDPRPAAARRQEGRPPS